MRTLRGRLLFMVAVPLLGLLVVLALALFSVAKVSNALDMLYLHPYAVSTTIRGIETELVSIHRDMKDVALSQDKGELVNIETAIQKRSLKINGQLAHLEDRFLGDKKQISDFRKSIDGWTAIREKVISHIKNGERDAATQITKTEGREQVQNLLSHTASLREFADSKAEVFYQNSITEMESSKRWLGVLAVATFVFSLLFGLYFAQIISKRISLESRALSENVARLCEVALTLGKSSLALSGVVSSQSRRFATVASAATEISTSSESTSQKADELRSSINDLTELAQQGVEALTQLRNSLDQMKRTVQALFTQLENNAENVSSLESVVKLVDSKAASVTEVVFQTKLLSFNASVEAARAGEAGKGFSVVAEEIGQLASLSGKSAEEIKAVVADALKKVGDAASSIRSGAEQLSTSVSTNIKQSDAVTQLCENIFENTFKRVQGMQDLIQDVANASREQTQGVSDVERALADLSNLSEETLASATNFTQLSRTVGDEVKKVEGVTTALSDMVNG